MTYTLIQISDCHLGESPGDRLLGLDADQSLAWVLARIAEIFPHYDALVCSGDLSNEAGLPAFKRLLAQLAERPCQSPIYWLPGNHDDHKAMRELSTTADQQLHFLASFCLGDWQLSCFDSTLTNSPAGSLSAAELHRMQQTLAQHQDKSHLFFMHHPAVAIGTAWIDPQHIDNGEAVIALSEQYSQLKALVSGHVHQAVDRKLSTASDARMLCTPATSVQFKPACHDFTLDDQMPGFRWFQLQSNGQFTTGVERIAYRPLAIDAALPGY